MENINPDNQTLQPAPEKPKSSWQWGLSEEQLKNQVDNYETLKIYQSYRGIGALLILLSVAVTALAIYFQLFNVYAFTDIVIWAFLAIFVYRGARWALIAAAILWTLEKVYSGISSPGSAVIVVIWWLAYLQVFYRAWQVEQARRMMPPAPEVPKLA